uniref:Myosin heavy chain, clone n=1 Tax=Solanum tuberosum TaxID=4113 RepID=M1B0Z1_SOLTU
MDSIGGESWSFWSAYTLLRVDSAAYCAARASFFSLLRLLISRFCNICSGPKTI